MNSLVKVDLKSQTLSKSVNTAFELKVKKLPQTITLLLELITVNWWLCGVLYDFAFLCFLLCGALWTLLLNWAWLILTVTQRTVWNI